MEILVGRIYRYVPNEAMCDIQTGPGTYGGSLEAEMRLYGNKKIFVQRKNAPGNYLEPSYTCVFEECGNHYTILASCIKSITKNKPGEYA